MMACFCDLHLQKESPLDAKEGHQQTPGDARGKGRGRGRARVEVTKKTSGEGGRTEEKK
jgi:hypothetical protein